MSLNHLKHKGEELEMTWSLAWYPGKGHGHLNIFIEGEWAATMKVTMFNNATLNQAARKLAYSFLEAQDAQT